VTARSSDRRLGISELAERLGVSGRTVTRWCAAGTFPPCHYVGVNRKWLLSEVVEWEAQNTGRPAQLDQRVRNLGTRTAGAPQVTP